MTEFATQVAKQLDRRRMRRRLGIWITLLALVVLAATYLRCGRGWGLGGGSGTGKGDGSGSARVTDAGPARCVIRIAAAGITVDGTPATRAEAVTRCAATTGADVIVTGDARQGDWDQLRTALDAAHIPVFTRDGAARP